MAGGTIPISTAAPEDLNQVRGEISGANGDVSVIRVSGEQVPAIIGTQIYLNDIILSRAGSVVTFFVGDSGVVYIGQNQQVSISANFFQHVNSSEQIAPTHSGVQFTSAERAVVIDIATLEQAVRIGQNIEKLLEPTASYNDFINQNSDLSSPFIFFH